MTEPEAAPTLDQLAQWKRALADYRRGQRARRWKRPPPITGIRVPAPRAEEGTSAQQEQA